MLIHFIHSLLILVIIIQIMKKTKKIIKYFIMTNDKEIYYKFGLDDSEIDRFRNTDNWFEFTHNGNETKLNIILYN